MMFIPHENVVRSQINDLLISLSNNEDIVDEQEYFKECIDDYNLLKKSGLV